MKLLNILFPVLITFFSCSKNRDLSYWNTDRRPQVLVISQRYTDPPKWANKNEWKVDTTVYYYLPQSVDTLAYHGVKPDTIHSTCFIQGSADSLFWEIRNYKIITY